MPKPTADFLDRNGHVAREWRNYLFNLPADEVAAELQDQINALGRRISDIASGTAQNNLIGQGSIRVFGDLSQDNATAQLDGDENAPAASHFYGTDEDGRRGFHALPDPPPATGGILPIVTGDINNDQPVFVYADNGSLIYSEVA